MLFPFTRQQRQQLRQNYQILQQAAEKWGKRYEQKSYAELLHLEDEMIQEIEDEQLSFSVEVYQIKTEGTLCVCLDMDGLPTLFAIKPSYHFYKRPDETVYY